LPTPSESTSEDNHSLETTTVWKMSFTIEALLGIQPKVESEEIPQQIPMNKSCSEDEESIEESIELEGERLVYYHQPLSLHHHLYMLGLK
jgi:hypothetical protein